MTLRGFIERVWSAAGGGKPPERVLDELTSVAVREQVRPPTAEEWRREQARKKFEENRGLSQRRLARLCRVNRRTIEKWCSEPVATAPEHEGE